MPRLDKSASKAYMKKYYAKNKAKMNEDNKRRGKERHKEAKLKCLTHYSDNVLKCACCDEDKYDFLTLNHINGGGNKHRQNIKQGRTFYEMLVNQGFPDGLNVMCYNCNIASGILGKCPHKG